MVEVGRVAKKLADKVAKETVKKNVDNVGDGTHHIDVDIPGKSTTCTKTDTTMNGLGLGLWEPFQLAKVIDLRSFMYDIKLVGS
jgi:hypothetical protein